MRSSVPCSSWIDSFSLLDIQVVSLKRDYYVSLACQVDSREIARQGNGGCWGGRGPSEAMTIEKSASCAFIGRLGPGTYVDDRGSSEVVMSLPCSRFSETICCILARQYQGNGLIERNRGLGRSGWTASRKIQNYWSCVLGISIARFLLIVPF